MTTAIFKVYGRNGNDQRVASRGSMLWTCYDGTQFAMIGSDVTGTKEYAIMITRADTLKECRDNVRGQITDGLFENVAHGKCELVSWYKEGDR